MSPRLQLSFTKLPAELFPMVMEFVDVSGKTVHRIDVEGPGVINVPGLSKKFGPVGVRVTYGNGEKSWEPPP